MAFLLDTNVVSELRKPRPHGAVLAWLQSTNDADLHLASVTLGEIQAGIEITRDQDPVKAQEIERWLDQMCGNFNLLPMDGAAFRCWAQLMHRRSDTLYEDAMIAAIARVHNLTVVTRNVADFQGFGVALLNPFELR
ncbi:MAG: type II toxin-antitoxin system VapC family toxin [Cyanobacteria bacterium]|nr:type II toxin-antitoxin system VapC family toxin [Cyanobacteriota bacterium]